MIGFTFTVETVEESDRIFFEDLYKKYNRLMFLIANRYCSKLSDCEDIVQDSVVNLCSKVKLLRDLPSYALPSYIHSKEYGDQSSPASVGDRKASIVFRR